MKKWQGDDDNISAAQKILSRRAYLNSLAASGKYVPPLEANNIKVY